MGFSVEAMANAPYYGYLPMGVSNFGGDIQIFHVPEYGSNQIGVEFNPYALASLQGAYGYNPTDNWDYNGGAGTNGLAAAGAAAVNNSVNRETSSIINSTLNTVASFITKLEAALNKEGVTEEQKTKINEQLTKLKEQQTKLNELKEKTNELTVAEANKQAKDIKAEVDKIIKDINALNLYGTTPSGETPTTPGGETPSTPGGTTPTTPGSETPTTPGGTTPTAPGSETPTTPGGTTPTTPSGGGSTTGGTATNPSQNTYPSEITSNVDKFYDATYCTGTKDEQMEEVLNAITADNVMDYMTAWNKLHSSEKGESFMKAFMWDADKDQKEKYGKAIARALRDKAEQVGVHDDCKEDFAKIDKELGSWFYISNDIYENFDNIIKKIAEKMGGKYKQYAEPSKKE